jgi:hypothetical protein
LRPLKPSVRPAKPSRAAPASPASRAPTPELSRPPPQWSSEIPAFAGIYWALLRTGDVEMVRLAPAIEGLAIERLGVEGSVDPHGVVVAWSGPLQPPRPAR